MKRKDFFSTKPLEETIYKKYCDEPVNWVRIG